MGEPASFDERFDSLAALAYRVAYRLVGDRHIAENLAQEALARALRYLGDLTEAQTAAALGCSKGSVKQHAHRGLAAMRSALTDTEPTDRDGTDRPQTNQERERHVRAPR